MDKEDFVLFWRGPFSNWHPSPFVIDDVRFNCVEQWMMWTKAFTFSDFETAEKIMAANNPKEQKALGRMVVGFDQEVWKMECFGLVLKGVLAKFSQNPELLGELLATGEKILVEASPYDTVWGIGLGEENPDALDPKKWKGRNLLGQVLMAARSILRS